jgi:hypothetical protein
MFNWYRNALLCFAFPGDVGDVDGADTDIIVGSVCASMSLRPGTPEDGDGFDTNIMFGMVYSSKNLLPGPPEEMLDAIWHDNVRELLPITDEQFRNSIWLTRGWT